MPRTTVRTAVLAGLLIGVPSLSRCAAQEPRAGPAQRSATPAVVDAPLRVDTVARGLEHPWGLAFLPDGRILVTERPGRLRIVDRNGALSAPLSGVPAVAARQQGGLLDVTIDPRFADNQLVYLSFSEPGEGGLSGTAVARGRLGAAGLENVQVIYRQTPKVNSAMHFGSRVVFDRQGRIFVTQGDRYNQRPRVQDLSSTIGKVVRINADGTVPNDNPFVGRQNARPEIWSYGHRNVQAAALHPQTGQLWTVEHGARGGDEVNIPGKGRNYGWPVISYGVHYSGEKIGEGTRKPGLEQPAFYWDPSVAPSGMAFYTGDKFPAWRGSILVGALAGKLVSRLETSGNKVTGEERMLQNLGERIRDVRQGPDGFIYLLTDSSQGRILRMKPAS